MSYIEREAALDAISEWLMKALHTENMSSYNEGERAAYRTALSEIANLPAADVRPVKRGRWERIEDDFGKYDRCSNCGKEYAFGPLVTMHYCPNCGAMMEES